MKSYYFDYNATTPVEPKVLEEMRPYLEGSYGNPSSFYSLGRVAASAIRKARRAIASACSVSDPGALIFTSGGTESNNTAIRAALQLSERKEIIISAVEHSSVRSAVRLLAQKGDCVVHEIGVNAQGELDLDKLKRVLSDKIALVSVMMANNETGAVSPSEKIGALVKTVGAYFHVDAAQAFGKIPVDLTASSIDFMSLSAHKVYGPKGVGVLYIHPKIKVTPLIFGGSQEYGWRAGTENVAGIVGFGRAAELISAEFEEETSRIQILRDLFETEVVRQIPDIEFHAREVPRLPNTSNLYFKGIEAEILLISLDQENIFASKGSACMSGGQEPSYVLKAMGCSDAEVEGSIRISFGRFSTRDEVEFLLKKLTEIVSRLRQMERV